jgi:HlyD family secretion protein
MFNKKPKTMFALTSRRPFALTGILLLLTFVSGCGKKEAEAEPVVAVQTAVAQTAPIQRIVTSEAILFPLQQAALTPKITAPVQKFLVNRGDHVRQGQLLAVLENRDLSAAESENKGNLKQAQATYKTMTAASLPEEIQKAELELQGTKTSLEATRLVYQSRQSLFEQGALPRKELDLAKVAHIQAQNQFDIAQKHLNNLQSIGKEEQLRGASGQLMAAQAKYEGAAAQLGYSEIRTPIDGFVTDRPFYPGEMAAAGIPLMTVMDISQIIARAHIPQREASWLKVSNPATIRVPGTEDEIAGTVTVVSPAVDPNSTTVEVWIQAPNPQFRLRPGETVQVSIVAEEMPNAVVIPATSLLTAPDRSTSVMVVTSDNHAKQQPVEAGIRQNELLQIVKGLKAGEKVISVGAYGLSDKTKVTAEEEADSKKDKNGSAAAEPKK